MAGNVRRAIGHPRDLSADYEWATLFALRIALRNGSVYVAHSFDFRSQATLLIPDDE